MPASSLDRLPSADAQRLPEFWPDPPPPAPVRAWWIPWPLAVLLVPLLWLSPKRMGPHFAAVRWPGVIVGHVFWIAYGIGCIAIAQEAPQYGWIAWLTGQSPGQAEPSLWPPPTAWDIFRAPLALGTGWLPEVVEDLPTFCMVVVGLLCGEVLLLAMGPLMMPYMAAGEPQVRLAVRTIKLALWATSSTVVLGLALQAAALVCPQPHRSQALDTAICALYAGWFFWLWPRSGMRYAGPAQGPGWEPRRPACESCGYVLTGLTPADHCPECGRAVALSMPDRRQPSPYAAAHGLTCVPAFFATAVRVLLDRLFFERLALRDAYPAARRFAIRMCLLASAVTAGLGVAGVGYEWDRYGWIHLQGPAEWAAAFLTAWMGLFAIMLGATAMAANIACDFWGRWLVPRSTLGLYHSAWLLPLGIMIVCTMAGLTTLGKVTPRRLPEWDTLFWEQFPYILLALIPGVLTVLLGVLALVRLGRAVRQVRFANG